MSKFDETVNALFTEASAIDSSISKKLITTVCTYLGPSLFNRDSATVAYSDKAELTRVKESFVKGKLGVKKTDDVIDADIKAVGEAYGMSNRSKKRAIVYAMLMKKYNKASL